MKKKKRLSVHFKEAESDAVYPFLLIWFFPLK